MVWHDCKTDPPKKSGFYLVFFCTLFGKGVEVLRYVKEDDEAWFEKTGNNYKKIVRKWAEVDLSEVE